jgi:hypothetical protein
MQYNRVVERASPVKGDDIPEGIADYDRVSRSFIRKDLARRNHCGKPSHVVGGVAQKILTSSKASPRKRWATPVA